MIVVLFGINKKNNYDGPHDMTRQIGNLKGELQRKKTNYTVMSYI